jgi:hypothetical protein
MRKLLVGIPALAAMTFAAPAMAEQLDAQNYQVDVNIHVNPIVSLWGFEDTISLAFQGNDGNNTSFHNSSFAYLNNTPADISVTVTGDFGQDADDVNFYVADADDGAVVKAAMLTTSAYAPTGVGTVLHWDFNTPPASQTQVFKSNLAVQQNGTTEGFSYLINAPGGAGGEAGDDYALSVTWTIAESP